MAHFWIVDCHQFNANSFQIQPNRWCYRLIKFYEMENKTTCSTTHTSERDREKIIITICYTDWKNISHSIYIEGESEDGKTLILSLLKTQSFRMWSRPEKLEWNENQTTYDVIEEKNNKKNQTKETRRKMRREKKAAHKTRSRLNSNKNT